MSTSLLILTSAEKFINVYFPIAANRICTLKTARYVSLALIGGFTIFESQWFFIVKDNGSGSCVMINSKTRKYLQTYLKIDATLYSYLPLSLMFIFNSLIIAKLLWAKRKSQRGEVNSLALSKAATGVTIMLICLSVMFILFTLPYVIVYKAVNNVSSVTYAVALLLMYANHSSNIIIYSLSNTRFRTALKQSMLACCKSRKILPSEQSRLSGICSNQ